eukprot:gnl/TRDRNA2_/TRDRNA2_164371_c0_seq2.p1 gnl/TRDRNA2_/TRDRNA2_164371_c0~~gnl/TRDRNA2_/TRDRNA2_164371_c0_seq2.p1  ORF type:complete len:401 (+),score=148.37 gnl/TRDRNA2_/TRDRNA2_164371_c0_seq2:94-1296(+)
MVAKKQGTKRTAASEHESAPARKRTAQQKKMLDGIISTLNGAACLPQADRDLLVALVYGGLGCPKDERHKYQTLAVDKIGEALEVIRANMQNAVAAENEKLIAIEASKSKLDKVHTQAEELLATKAAASKEAKAHLAQVSSALSQAKKALAECQEAQRKDDADHAAHKKEASQFETALEQQFKPLKAGNFESDDQAKQLFSAMESLVPKLDLEESMVTSLPAAAAKKPDERGTFDSMIFDEFEKILVAKIADLKAKIAEGAPAAAKRSEAVTKAGAAVDDAKAKVTGSATQLSAAQAEEKEQADVLKAAEKAVKDFAPTFKKATQARDQLVCELELFNDWSLTSFNTLKEHIEKKDEEMPSEEQGASVEGSEEAPASEEVPAKTIPEKSLAPDVVRAVGA